VSWLRIGLPAAIAVAGVICIAVGGDAGLGAGIVLLGVAVLVVVANLLIRLSIADQEERAREERRRERGWPGG
jgi:drug/metabolite transporter (DMT)-like permease